MKIKYKVLVFIMKNINYINDALVDRDNVCVNEEMKLYPVVSFVFVEEMFRSFFDKFDFPDDLFAINTASDNAETMIPIFRDIESEKGSNITVHWELAINILRVSIVNKYKLDLVRDIYADKDSSKDTSSGYLGENPLYGMIRLRLPNRETTINFTHLITHLHMAYPVLIKLGVSHDFLDKLGATARHMQKDNCSELLSAFPKEACSQLTYKMMLNDVLKNQGVSSVGKGYLEKIIHAFDIEDGTKDFISKDGSKHGNNKGGGKLISLLPERMFIESMEPVEIFSEDIDDLKYLKLQSSEEYEEGYSGEAILIKPNSNKFINTDPQKIILHMKGKENAIHLFNQMLPTDYSQLSIFEVSALIHELSNTLFQSKDTAKHNDLKLLLIVCIVLFYGRSIEEIINMRVYNISRNKLIDKVNVSYALNDGMFMLRPAVPNVKGKLKAEQKEATIHVEPILKLKSCVFISQLIGVLWKGQDKRCKKGMLFSGMQLKRTNRDITLFLNEVNLKHNTSLSITKVYKNIYQKIARVSKDVVAARYITGQIDSRIASQASYTTYSSLALSKFHVESVGMMIGYASNEFDEDLSGWLSEIHDPSDFIGTRFSPNDLSVKNMVKNILLRMKRLNDKQSEWFVEYHNLYTAYSILMLDFSTGHRSIDNKYCLTYEINFNEMIMVISDKGGDNYAKARIAPLTSICCEQYKLYGKYREEIVSRLVGYSDSNRGKKISPKKRRDLIKLKSSVNCYFFFIDESLNVEKITPSNFKVVVKEYYPLKLDTPRHYISTGLKSRGLSGEKIDAVMGHWLSGQNPSNRFSSYVFKDALDQTRSLLSSIMSDDGWKLHKGPVYATS